MINDIGGFEGRAGGDWWGGRVFIFDGVITCLGGMWDRFRLVGGGSSENRG